MYAKTTEEKKIRLEQEAELNKARMKVKDQEEKIKVVDRRLKDKERECKEEIKTAKVKAADQIEQILSWQQTCLEYQNKIDKLEVEKRRK